MENDKKENDKMENDKKVERKTSLRTNRKKNKKNKKIKKENVYRTKKERQEKVKKVIKQLSEFQLNISYKPNQKLYALFKEYIEEDKQIKINIPFPEINRRIKGLLSISKNEEVWVNLQHEKF